jgi:hypothetical protein
MYEISSRNEGDGIMNNIKPKPGETAAEYLKRCVEETHGDTPISAIAAEITYQINGEDVDPHSLKPIDFKDRKISITFDVPVDPSFIQYAWNAAHLTETKSEYSFDESTKQITPMDKTNRYYMDINRKKKRIDTRLKRLLK